MLTVVEQHRPQIEALCRKYQVKRLELFGSAARGEFSPAESDLDFLVLFNPPVAMDHADRFFGFQEELQELFKRKVDVIDISVATNPYFVASALRDRVRLYAA